MLRRLSAIALVLTLSCREDVPAPAQLSAVDEVANDRGEFTLAVAPSEVSIEQGASVSTAIVVTRIKHFKKDVEFSASGLPDGVAVTFDPNVSDDTLVTATLSVSSAAALGTSTVMITGTANGRPPESVDVALEVQPPTTPLSLDFCASDAPLWFAYRNEGHPWTQVVPDANATVSFRATSKVAIALTRVPRNPGGIQGSGRITSVLYVTAAELLPLSGVTCANEFGTKVLNGNFAGLKTGETGQASFHLLPFSVTTNTTFRATRKPDAGALDLVAARRVGGGGSLAEPVSVIVRRKLQLENEAVVPTIDFGSGEAVPTEVHQFSVAGLRNVNKLLQVDFWTDAVAGGLPSFQRLISRGGSQVTATGSYPAVPSQLLAPGDRHEFMVRTGDNSDYAGVTVISNAALDRDLVIGPNLSAASFTRVSNAPQRFVASAASQPEYNATTRLIASATSGPPFNSFTVEVTTSHLGGTPDTWRLEIPDFNAVPGWDSNWNLQQGQSVSLELSAWSAAAVDIPPLWIVTTIPPWVRPFPNETTLRFAARKATLAP